MTNEFDDATAVAQANFLLTRNLLKYLYVSGKFEDGELSALLDGSIKAAEGSSKPAAAEVLRGLRVDLNAYDL
ncbi:hypothetical protein [Caulobacter sp. 17J80-11]|uniref:hypothetical protein n=1 Tax=Caulobacter sp. 17J80-11 TaxID=2763502 RepID=UPI0016534374|nr:hypothetical protein [Caulobacter sp. 17J80-11]MBC6981302.1 hypothetical protein [Caulobacter sp. 17J80-11]